MSDPRNPGLLEAEVQSLRQENARLRQALDEILSNSQEPEEVVRAIRQGEIDALVVQENGQEQIYSLQRYDSVYRGVVEEALPYGVWLAQSEGKLLYVSRTFLDLVGTTLPEMQQKGMFHFLPAETRERAERQWQQARQTGQPFGLEYAIQPAAGDEQTIWTHGIFTSAHDGLSYWAGINLDVTERNKIKDAVRQQAEALKEADRRKDQFLAILGHELRGPLAPLRNAVELLRLASGDPQLVEHACGIMERQLEQMVRLIDDLLDVSRISRGKVQLRLQRTELAQAVAHAVEAARPLIESAGHELMVTLPEDPIYLNADLARLAQVLSNLLTNAAKYTEHRGRIWVMAEHQSGQAVISVQDTGIGISSEHLPHLFEIFSQVAPAQERSQGGLGIGLSLVKGLVEMHGGTVEAQSDGIGKGSTFRVRLPVAEVPQEPGPSDDRQDQQAARSASCRVLIADDNRDSAESLALVLRLKGHEVQTVHNGAEAVQKAEAFQPHVMLLDIGMPSMNGYTTAEHIRQQPWGASVTLIATTGWGQQEDKRRAQEAGFDHHLTKPVASATLEKLLAEVCQRQV